MARRLFLFIRALSLVLCAAFSALWVRSVFTLDLLTWTAPGPGGNNRIVEIVTLPGQIRVTLAKGDAPPSPPQWESGSKAQSDTRFGHRTVYHGWTPLGVAVNQWTQFISITDSRAWPRVFRMNCRLILVPIAWPVFLCALLPAVMGVRGLRRRRRRRGWREQGRCAFCGYDLRAGLDSATAGGAILERCPECGRIPVTISLSPPSPELLPSPAHAGGCPGAKNP